MPTRRTPRRGDRLQRRLARRGVAADGSPRALVGDVATPSSAATAARHRPRRISAANDTTSTRASPAPSARAGAAAASRPDLHRALQRRHRAAPDVVEDAAGARARRCALAERVHAVVQEDLVLLGAPVEGDGEAIFAQPIGPPLLVEVQVADERRRSRSPWRPTASACRGAGDRARRARRRCRPCA